MSQSLGIAAERAWNARATSCLRSSCSWVRLLRTDAKILLPHSHTPTLPHSHASGDDVSSALTALLAARFRLSVQQARNNASDRPITLLLSLPAVFVWSFTSPLAANPLLLWFALHKGDISILLVVCQCLVLHDFVHVALPNTAELPLSFFGYYKGRSNSLNMHTLSPGRVDLGPKPMYPFFVKEL